MPKKIRALEFIWKHQIWVGLLTILVVQALFLYFKLILPDQATSAAFMDVSHVLFTSSFAVYLFSKKFESFLRARLYQGIQNDWQEVRVVYSQERGLRGTGEIYPREPTILIHPPVFEDLAPPGHFLGGRSMMVSFNSAYEGKPVEGEDDFLNGKWSELKTVSDEYRTVGFQDALYRAGLYPAEK